MIHVLSRHVTSRHVTPRHATPRHATPRHATPRHATPRHATPRHATSRHVTSRHVTSRHVTSRHVTSRHVTSRHVTSHRLNINAGVSGRQDLAASSVANAREPAHKGYREGEEVQEEAEHNEGAVPEEGRQGPVVVVEHRVDVRLPVNARAARLPVDDGEQDVDRRVHLGLVEV